MNNTTAGDTPVSVKFSLSPDDTQLLAQLCGHYDSNIKQIEERLDIRVHNRGAAFKVEGSQPAVVAAQHLIEHLYEFAAAGNKITQELVHLSLQEAHVEEMNEEIDAQEPQGGDDGSVIKARKVFVKPRGRNQKTYVAEVRKNDINFGIGPAGTGKTFLAVACAVEAFDNDKVERILLVRPAVEAGEKLGFLPGDLAQKIDPYLRPLYDALYEMFGFEQVSKLIERNVIEVAPLAYMRGRTLNNAFIILDESQNTTREQMKMFLTRIGFGSTAVITGDVTQIDLPRGTQSGLKHAMAILDNVPGISLTHFGSKDVVRHPLVQRIVEAYDVAEQAAEKAENEKRAEREQQRR